MKKMTLIFTIIGMAILYSCGGSPAANKMADEMCAVMEKCKDDEPMSMVEAASDINDIKKKKDEYGEVTEIQLMRVMRKKCPEGWRKYNSLSGK